MRSLQKLEPLALLLLRVAMGVLFIHYGYPKLFVHPRSSVAWFAQHGFPGYFAYLSGVLELFGGLLLIAGLFTRVAGLLLAIEMGVALWKVHGLLADPLAVQNYQFPLMMGVAALALAAVGAGVISLDQAIFRESRGSARPARAKAKA
ncbi:MAG: DoxX family protein [Acidobacteriota bacterium]|nr:DoxX family protein [Acidobacteriota bacterium]MDE3170340.1 DoxX family protein [Acidobacteriota bacterium]